MTNNKFINYYSFFIIDYDVFSYFEIFFYYCSKNIKKKIMLKK